MVYLPVGLTEAGEVDNVRMVGLDDGRVALMGYTALDRFISCCGEQQPWMLFETEKLEELREIKHFDFNFLDVALPPHLRATEPTPTEPTPADRSASGEGVGA